jgi:hypothetical protein
VYLQTFSVFVGVGRCEQSMRPRIRSFEDRDAEAVVYLSLRAWAPVFASLEQVLGSDIFERLHPDWREDQRRAVEDVLAAKEGRVWVAEVDATAVGFVASGLSMPRGAWARSPCWPSIPTTRTAAWVPP